MYRIGAQNMANKATVFHDSHVRSSLFLASVNYICENIHPHVQYIPPAKICRRKVCMYVYNILSQLRIATYFIAARDIIHIKYIAATWSKIM